MTTTAPNPAQSRTTGPVRLRPAVHVTQVPDGLLVIGWQTRLLVSGGTALHRVWDAIGPHLNNGVDPSDLVRALPEKVQDLVRSLVEALDEGDMLVATRSLVEPGDAHPEHPSRTITRLLDFLDSAADTPQLAWHRIRSATVAVVGTGPTAVRVGRLLLEHGVGSVRMHRELAAEVRSSTGPGIGAPEAVPEGTVADGADLLVTVDADPSRWMGRRIEVVQLPDRAVVLPVTAGPSSAPAVLSRMGATQGPAGSQDRTPVTVSLLAAAQATVHAIYDLAQIRTEYDGKATVIAADRLRISHHRVWPDEPLATTTADGREKCVADPELLTELTDPLTGPLPEALPVDHPQNPFAVAVTDDTHVLGAGVTGAAARYRAALESSRVLLARSGNVPREAVTGAGADYGQFAADAVGRALADRLDGPTLAPGTGPALSSPAAPVTAVRDRLRSAGVRPESLTVEHHRLHHDPGAAAVAVVRGPEGRLEAIALGPDPEAALVRAGDHVTARAQVAWRGGVVPQLGLAEGLPEEDQAWSPDPARLLAAVSGGAEVRVERLVDHHPISALGVVGWVAFPEVAS